MVAAVKITSLHTSKEQKIVYSVDRLNRNFDNVIIQTAANNSSESQV